MIRTAIGPALTALMCWGSTDGQTADGPPAFEAASVRPGPPLVDGVDYCMRGGPGTDDPGQITYPRTMLLDLLMRAYGVRINQVSCPDCIRAERYSVVAKIPPNTNEGQFRVLLQNLWRNVFT